MGGTILNVIAVLLGSGAGVLVGNRLSKRVQESVISGLALVVLFIGIDNASATGNIIVPLLSIVIGVIIGEMLRLDTALNALGGWLQRRFAGRETPVSPEAIAEGEDAPAAAMDARERFITGFVTASLVYCIGPLAMLGAIQDGMGLPAGLEQLAVKSTLDAFASVAFAATFGIGVAFSALSVLVYQGSIALIGYLAGNVMSDVMIAEMTATGGIILLGLAIVMLEVKDIRVANFLPALLVAPLLVALGELLGIPVYPF